LLKRNQKKSKLSLQTVTEKLSMKLSNMLKRMLRHKRKQKLITLNKSTISTNKLLKRPTTKTPSLKPEDKFQFKESSLMVDKLKSLLLTKQIQLQQLQLLQLLQPSLPKLLQLSLLTLLQQRPWKKLFFKIQKIHINKKLSLWKQFSKPPRLKELSKLPAIKMLLLLKRNISNNLRTRRTLLELIERFKVMEDSFTIHQLLINITMLPNLLSKRKEKRKKLQTKLSHSPHLNLINKRKNL